MGSNILEKRKDPPPKKSFKGAFCLPCWKHINLYHFLFLVKVEQVKQQLWRREARVTVSLWCFPFQEKKSLFVIPPLCWYNSCVISFFFSSRIAFPSNTYWTAINKEMTMTKRLLHLHSNAYTLVLSMQCYKKTCGFAEWKRTHTVSAVR